MTIKKLLRSLVGHKVKFVVIGAWAFPSHGYSRATYDIDFFYEPTKANIKRIIAGLREVWKRKKAATIEGIKFLFLRLKIPLL
ncbi:MAG: hypothetical protein KA247_00640 [Bacteroidetes bacterium]|nr:hypothetical protein [Bacteroidota bacterium]